MIFRRSALCCTAAILLTLANPAAAAVVGYDSQGAFLGVRQDVYVGGKFGGKLGVSPTATMRATNAPPVAGLPAVDPAILFGIALLAVLWILSNDGGDDSKVSDTIAPPPDDDTIATPVPPGVTQPSTPEPEEPLVTNPLPPGFTQPSAPPRPPEPEVPLAVTPLPAGLVLLLAGLGGLALLRARRS